MSRQTMLGLGLFPLLAANAAAQLGSEGLVDRGFTNPTVVRGADLDGDGDHDVLVVHSTRVDWVECTAPQEFGTRHPIYSIPFVNSPVDAEAADLDGDGDQDVVVLRGGNGDLRWYENLGQGTFAPAQFIDVFGNDNTGLSLADLDGDGDVDVVSQSRSNDELRGYENLGGGAFGPRLVLTTEADNVSEIALTDVDADGDLDALAACSGDDVLSWFENLGGLNFGPEQVITNLPLEASHVSAGDIDGDGDPDALVASWRLFNQLGELRWIENLGGGQFGGNNPIDGFASFLFNGSQMVQLVDMTGDGLMDVLLGVYGFSNSGRLRLYVNQGAGTFSSPVTATTTDPVFGIHAADLDGDLDPDVLTAHNALSSTDPVGWIENLYFPTERICSPAVANSTGQPSFLWAAGSIQTSENELTLRALGVPTQTFGYFLASRDQDLVPQPGGSQGVLCLGGAISRFTGPGQVQSSGTTGTYELTVDLAQLPTPTGPVVVVTGETWIFQCWHRDVVQSMTTSNFTDAVSITFE